ncbi:MAG: hypothetical protein IJO22_08395 [Oscillospiraceae bacterium]|nr:hypothetical protein [Oscillospiraceae bacterium]
MADKNNGWSKPEEKFPETELEDSFAEFFSEEEEKMLSEKGKKNRRKRKGPDILAVADETDSGMVITEVVALDTGSEIVSIKEEQEEKPVLNGEKAGAQEEKDDAHEENEPEEKTESNEEVVVDLLKEKTAKGKKVLFPNAKKYIGAKRKHKYAATVGAVLIALALLGTISLVSILVNLGIRIIDNSSQKEEFEWKIYPLLMFDPATFENPGQLDEVFILKTALWSNLLENRTKYDYDDMGRLVVPASDLDVAAKSLYGDAVTLEHQSFAEGYDFFYIYDEETGTYSVPIMGQTASYVPKVVEIRKESGIYTLIVGYVAPTTLWNVSEDGSSESVPDKYLYYDLEKLENGNFVVKSVRRIPEDELPEDLEVAEMQSMNETQYIDYDSIQQEYMNQQMGGENSKAEETSEEGKTEEASSEEESSESSESKEE